MSGQLPNSPGSGDAAQGLKMGSTGSFSRDANERTNAQAEAAVSEAMQEAAKAGSSLDSIIGRLVIDQGLATPEEVQSCIKQFKDQGGEDPNQKSLAQLLVDNEYVTERQIVRLKQVIEAERSGQQIPGFKILGKLGAGAMATVYKARQLSLNRTVAIKILPRKFSSNPQFIERFYAEGRAAAQLNHPNIVQAFDVGRAGEFH